MVCDDNTGLSKESNFDRESINRNVASNDKIHEYDSLYVRPAKLTIVCNATNTVRKNRG